MWSILSLYCKEVSQCCFFVQIILATMLLHHGKRKQYPQEIYDTWNRKYTIHENFFWGMIILKPLPKIILDTYLNLAKSFLVVSFLVVRIMHLQIEEIIYFEVDYIKDLGLYLYCSRWQLLTSKTLRASKSTIIWVIRKKSRTKIKLWSISKINEYSTAKSMHIYKLDFCWNIFKCLSIIFRFVWNQLAKKLAKSFLVVRSMHLQ